LNEEFKRSLQIEKSARVTGGCIHECYRVTIDGKDWFLKNNSIRHEDVFAAEADALAGLREAGYRAPLPQSHGVVAGRAYLLMEFLDLKGRIDFPALGRMLAQAHRSVGPAFGWDRDNYIGATPQANGWCGDWAQFWRERRLQPQLDLAKRNGFSINTGKVGDLLNQHKPQPSLLHGDLWSGNVSFTPIGPVVFDPAAYHGDREADLAMTELFGGFPQEFYDAYNQAFPLPAGYEQRKHLYNLYHLLNHLNLFGRSYIGQVEETLRLLLRL
jgi:protein-ribulosamine 3-kinase